MHKKKLERESYTTRVTPEHRVYLLTTAASLTQTRPGTTGSDLLGIAIEDLRKIPLGEIEKRLHKLDYK